MIENELSKAPAGARSARGSFLLVALGALVLMLVFLSVPPVQRTQEARVLETAREMLGKPWRSWMLPELNDEPRLEKPPLAYWLAAVAFKIAGVGEGAARVPFALSGWATVLIVMAVGDRWFNRRTAYFAAAVLVGGMMFAHLGRLAETDVLAAFFVTGAIVCILRGAEEHTGRLSSANWYRLSGLLAGGSVLAKGLPIVFVIVFLFAWAAVRRDGRMLWKWTLSGAPLLLALVALPWYAYLHATVGLETISREAVIGVRGMEHTGSFLLYFPDLLRAVAPWSALIVLAVILAIAVWKTQPPVRGPLIWFAAVFVPLLIARQRQAHYLLPALPPLAILTGWMLDQSIDRKLLQWKLIWSLLIATIAVMLLGSLAMPRIADKMRGVVAPQDWIFAAACAIASVGTLIVTIRSFARGSAAFAIVAAVFLTVLTQVWLPSLRLVSPRQIARQVRAVGDGPYYFYGDNISLPLLFYMRQTMPRLLTPQDLSREATNNPDMIVIAQTKSGITPPPVPANFQQAAEIQSDDQTFEIYRVR